MFNAPPYKIRDLTEDIIVKFKVYVPFGNEKEKAEFIKQQNAEDKDEDDDENSDMSSISTDMYKGDQPDGRYESRIMEFKYIPDSKFQFAFILLVVALLCRYNKFNSIQVVNSIQSRNKLETSKFYEFIEQVDKDGMILLIQIVLFSTF